MNKSNELEILRPDINQTGQEVAKEIKKGIRREFAFPAIAVFLILLFIAIFRTGWLGNPIGSFLHYGTCPNCGDSWFWKSNGSIKFGKIKDLSSEYGTPSMPFIEIQHGVMICKECLANPAGLDEVKIEQDLFKYEWPPEDAAQVKEAVIRYKKERLQNQ